MCVTRAKKVLQKGDRIRVTKCPGTKRTITFDSWDGNWIVSKSGINDYAATSIDRLNGEPINFKKEIPEDTSYISYATYLNTRVSPVFKSNNITELRLLATKAMDGIPKMCNCSFVIEPNIRLEDVPGYNSYKEYYDNEYTKQLTTKPCQSTIKNTIRSGS